MFYRVLEKQGLPLVKICSVCKIEKDLSQFRMRSDRPAQPKSECKDCARGYNRRYRTKVDRSDKIQEWRDKNPEQVKASRIEWNRRNTRTIEV
jgi:hypothetical protein